MVVHTFAIELRMKPKRREQATGGTSGGAKRRGPEPRRSQSAPSLAAPDSEGEWAAMHGQSLVVHVPTRASSQADIPPAAPTPKVGSSQLRTSGTFACKSEHVAQRNLGELIVPPVRSLGMQRARSLVSNAIDDRNRQVDLYQRDIHVDAESARAIGRYEQKTENWLRARSTRLTLSDFPSHALGLGTEAGQNANANMVADKVLGLIPSRQTSL